MLLQEVFNQPYKWEWRMNKDDVAKAAFYAADGTPYVFVASILDTELEGVDTWDIEFYRLEDGEYNQENRYDITDTGDQFKILSTITDITKSFVEQYQVRSMLFSAKEPSRMKLYKRMVRTLLPNWIVEYDIGSIAVYHPSLKGKI